VSESKKQLSRTRKQLRRSLRDARAQQKRNHKNVVALAEENQRLRTENTSLKIDVHLWQTAWKEMTIRHIGPPH
jgi:regulator of replication initiation timing